jgi:DNA-binding protein Fis
MIGRAAQGRPWIFREIAHFLATGTHLLPPTVAEAREIIADHLADHYAFYGEDAGVRTARKHLGWYTESLHGGSDFRRAMCAAATTSAQFAVGDRLFRCARHPVRAPAVSRREAWQAQAPMRLTNLGRGGPRSVMTRKTRINGSNEIVRSVDRSLEEYFKRLDGETPTGVYDMVIGHVERALLASIMTRTEGNQTQAADMLGMNRTTLRAKLVKHKLV